MQAEIRDRVRSAVLPHVRTFINKRMPELAPSLMQFAQFWPHDYQAASYSRPVSPDGAGPQRDGLPVPPREFWADYCTTAESYLQSGREDAETMRRLLGDSGFDLGECKRILDLGCAGGRMLRWIPELAPEAELWGIDIWSSAILWCQDHLSPVANFATGTMNPHLPFEDRSLDLVYCGSLFTHIDDLAETWFLELRRVLRPGGRLYFSINDHHAVRVFDGQADAAAYPRYWERTAGRENWEHFVDWISEQEDYQRFRRREAYMVTLGRSMTAHVMWDTDVLTRRLEYGYRTCSITPESYGHQTTVLLERT